MATRGSDSKMSEETFEFICTSCAEDDLIKEALKYCVDCQRYCCKDCLASHRRIPVLKGHSFLDNSSATPKRRAKSLPAVPTKQCSKHIGMIMYMYCKDHDAVCCYSCAAEDHRSCKDVVSISENVNKLYNKTDTTKATSELSSILDDMKQWKTNTDTVLRQLGNSKVSTIQAVKDYRIEIERILKKMEEASIKEIEEEYKTIESKILEEKKRFEDYIEGLKDLQQLFRHASGNIAQLFICTKLAEKKCSSIGDNEMARKRFQQAEVKFLPSEELKLSLKKMKNLGEASSILSSKYNLYTATKIHDINVMIKEDTSFYGCSITGSCIMADTVIFTDLWNDKLKRVDVSSSSLIDYCVVPEDPRGICKIEDKEVAVACREVVHFVSVDDRLSLSRSIKMKHKCYGIAHYNDKLYVTDDSKSLYMYDMSGYLLKTVTTDNSGQSLFSKSNHIIFNDKRDRLFVGDGSKGLVCFNNQCDYIKTVSDPDVRPDGVCVDSYGNVIVANYDLHTIVQCDRDGQKCGIIVNKTQENPRSVCIHHGQRKMFVGYFSNKVEVYNLTLKNN